MDRLREMADIAKEKTLQAAEIAKDAAKDAIDGEPPTPRSRGSVFALSSLGFLAVHVPLPLFYAAHVSAPLAPPFPLLIHNRPLSFSDPPSSPPSPSAPPRHGR